MHNINWLKICKSLTVTSIAKLEKLHCKQHSQHKAIFTVWKVPNQRKGKNKLLSIKWKIAVINFTVCLLFHWTFAAFVIEQFFFTEHETSFKGYWLPIAVKRRGIKKWDSGSSFGEVKKSTFLESIFNQHFIDTFGILRNLETFDEKNPHLRKWKALNPRGKKSVISIKLKPGETYRKKISKATFSPSWFGVFFCVFRVHASFFYLHPNRGTGKCRSISRSLSFSSFPSSHMYDKCDVLGVYEKGTPGRIIDT